MSASSWKALQVIPWPEPPTGNRTSNSAQNRQSFASDPVRTTDRAVTVTVTVTVASQLELELSSSPVWSWIRISPDACLSGFWHSYFSVWPSPGMFKLVRVTYCVNDKHWLRRRVPRAVTCRRLRAEPRSAAPRTTSTGNVQCKAPMQMKICFERYAGLKTIQFGFPCQV